MKTMNAIKMLLWNARGYGSKKEELAQKFREEEIDIGIVTEMKNKNNANTKQKFIGSISGYNSLKGNNYRNGQGGAGGVAIFSKKNIRIKEINLEEVQKKDVDSVAVMVYGIKENLAIIGIYRRSGKGVYKGNIKKIIQHVKKFGKKESDRKMSIVIAGDFNAHHEVWNCYNTDRSGEVLLAETEEEGLFVINYDTISRLGSPSQRDSNIDLLFANDSVIEKISYKQGYDTWGSFLK